MSLTDYLSRPVQYALIAGAALCSSYTLAAEGKGTATPVQEAKDTLESRIPHSENDLIGVVVKAVLYDRTLRKGLPAEHGFSPLINSPDNYRGFRITLKEGDKEVEYRMSVCYASEQEVKRLTEVLKEGKNVRLLRGTSKAMQKGHGVVSAEPADK